MKSTSNSRLIASIKDLNLLYQIDHYKNKSIKDSLISYVSSPFKSIMEKKKYYHVLKDINFSIYEGDRIGLIGINGAGKTSLCRCLAQMIVPQFGSIEIYGKVRAIFDTGIGILPELTGRENATIMASLLFPDLGAGEQHKLVLDALAFSELGEFEDVPYLKYSKGMQTRLGLSLVSSLGCDLLILDEVYDGADIFFQKRISQRLLKTIDESGAVLFVSHSVDQIETICNRLIIIDDSRIIFDGSPSLGLNIYKNLKQN